MNKVKDYGFTGSFFTEDIKRLAYIDNDKIHDIDVIDYSDKNKAEVLREYLKSVPNDELYITEAYISDTEYPIDKYCLYDIPNRKLPLIPVDKVLERENKIMEDAGFVNVNKYVDYEYKTAFIYPNEIGKEVIDMMNKRVLACDKELQEEKEIELD